MNYHLLIRGEDAGIFSLDDLRQRRLSGRLTGQELVWCEGMPNWAPLDSALGLVAPTRARKKLSPLAWAGIVAGGVLALLMLAFFAYVGTAFLRGFRRGLAKGLATPHSTLGPAIAASSEPGVEEASRPIQQNPKSPTPAQLRRRDWEFRTRQYVDAYRDLGPHDKPWDADAMLLIRGWIDSNYGDETVTNLPDLHALGDKLAADPSCDDGIALTAAAANCVEYYEQIHRYERAAAAFAHSRYKAYPRFFATVSLANAVSSQKDRVKALDKEALDLYRKMLSDGSLRQEDQEQIYQIFMDGWGEGFFHRCGRGIFRATVASTPVSYSWLGLMMNGRIEDNLAWAARGGGYANTVTTAGWQGFQTHTDAASNSLYQAWKLHPDWPEAPGLMVYVVMGDGDADVCRQWFDRATEARIDYPPAWFNIRWALRPQWFGGLAAIKALGVAGINTGRFDTDAPLAYFQCVNDIENEEQVHPSEYIYGRPDIWPDMKRMYEGYIASSAQARYINGWRDTYAIVSYFAQKYDVSREQLEMLHWQLPPDKIQNWGKDLSLLPLEVAARTSSLGAQIAQAEEVRDQDRFADALAMYQKLPAASADELTRKFIEHRLSMLAIEKRLKDGEWVDFLPTSDNDLNWTAPIGSYTVQPGGAVDVKAGPRGSMLICHARVGDDFEIKGQMEVISSTTKDFQGGVMLGMPEMNYANWYAFRLKRNANEGDVASFSKGGQYEGSFSIPATLDSRVNTFDFRVHDGTLQAAVNGKDLPMGGHNFGGPMWVLHDQFLAGLGAYNDMNETVIRYSKVQARRNGPQ